MRVVKKIIPAIAMTLLLSFSGCRRPAPAGNLPATWAWDQNQTFITPARGARNAWRGWAIKGGAFEAKSTESRIIFWSANRGQTKIYIDYRLEGHPVELIANNKVRKPIRIEPTSRSGQISFETQLAKGMNFLDFHIQDKDRLSINRIALGRPDPPETDDLSAGESVTLYLNPGQGKIDWNGSGELVIEKSESASSPGDLKTETSSRKTSFFSRTLRQEIDFSSPGIVTITAVSGHFNIINYEFREKPLSQEVEVKRRLTGDPPIFILLADACQAEHLSVYGYPRPTSPNIERFAQDAVVFENAYSNTSYTLSSVHSLMTGQYPKDIRGSNLTSVDGEPSTTIPKYLKAKGYRTSIFTSAVIISLKFGFGAGIDDYFQYLGSPNKMHERKIDLNRFGTWLRQPGPLFSYIHFIEPHLPILPPPPFLDMFSSRRDQKPRPLRERLYALMQRPTGLRRPFTPEEAQDVRNDYDSTIAYVDSEIGKALDCIKKAGLYEKSLIIIMADHGEAMYEHKAWGHSRNVYEETTHIPLVVKFPNDLNIKGRVRRLVQLTDVFPTITNLFGQSVEFPGRSLLEGYGRPGFDETMTVSQSIADAAQYGMRWGRWYYIISLVTGREALYNLDRDPLTEATTDAESIKIYFRARFLDWLRRTAGTVGPATRPDLKNLTPTEIENLKTLGYI